MPARRSFSGLLLTGSLFLLCGALLLRFTFPPLLSAHESPARLLLAFVLLSGATALATGVATAVRDPGVIPRAPPGTPHPAHPRAEVIVAGRRVPVNFCGTCRIWRPPRASHCAVTDRCVARFDHHCPWLANDVGEGNYACYVAFVLATAAAAGGAAAAGWMRVAVAVRESAAGAEGKVAGRVLAALVGTRAGAANAVMLFMCSCALAGTGGLSVFHLYLMWWGRTTKETLSRALDGKGDGLEGKVPTSLQTEGDAGKSSSSSVISTSPCAIKI